jgi:hypothetical protein
MRGVVSISFFMPKMGFQPAGATHHRLKLAFKIVKCGFENTLPEICLSEF